jgi:sugar phosphate isomerase/epimerase
MRFDRRQFLKFGLGAMPLSCGLADTSLLAAVADAATAVTAKPDSKFNGVQIGIIAPYSFRGMPGTAEDLLRYMVELGISAVELQNTPAERFAGAPAGGRGGGRRGGGEGVPGGGNSDITSWRASASMDKFKALRKMYNDAGVSIYGFKLDLRLNSPDSDYEYAFNVCEALGANQLTMELPNDPATTKRIGEYAAKRKIWVGYHAHTQAHLTFWDTAFSQSEYNGANIDIGHYVAGTSQSPIPFIEKHHKRITSMHFKDRKTNNGPNVPWGEGDTPLKEVLQLMKRDKHTYPATIELEYRVPEGSTVMAELAKCLKYAKDALA